MEYYLVIRRSAPRTSQSCGFASAAIADGTGINGIVDPAE